MNGTRGRSKIVNEQEIVTWFKEGRTYPWMVQQYRDKYGIEVGVTMFSNFRRRRGLKRRNLRDRNLIPWAVKLEHRYDYNLAMLRLEARVRAGKELTPEEAGRLRTWKRGLEEADAVVHYEPETADGFFLVPRRPGIDKDLVRVPEGGPTSRPAAD